MKVGRYEIVARLIKIARLAQEKKSGLTVTEAMAETDTGRRTVQRDFAALEDIGLGVIDRSGYEMKLTRPDTEARLTLFLIDWGASRP